MLEQTPDRIFINQTSVLIIVTIQLLVLLIVSQQPLQDLLESMPPPKS